MQIFSKFLDFSAISGNFLKFVAHKSRKRSLFAQTQTFSALYARSIELPQYLRDAHFPRLYIVPNNFLQVYSKNQNILA